MSCVFDKQLAHQIDEPAAARDLQSLVAVGGEKHVVRSQRHRSGHRHGLLARRFHVEGNSSLALRALHALVEQPCEKHVPQTNLQLLRIQVRVPRTDCTLLVIEHAHHVHRQRLDVAGSHSDVRPRNSPGGGDPDVAEIRPIAGPRRRMRNVQARGFGHYTGVSQPNLSSASPR